MIVNESPRDPVSRRVLITFVTIFALVILLIASTISSSGVAPDPVQGSATIDGDSSEWQTSPSDDTNQDFFAHMYRAGKDDKDVLSELFMRQQCLPDGNVRIFGLIVPVGQAKGIVESENDSFIKIVPDGQDPINGIKYVDAGDSPVDGSQPEWAWGPLNSDELREHAEFSFDIVPGMYQLNGHVNAEDESGSQTSAVADRDIDLTVTCVQPSNTPTGTATGTNTPEPSNTPTGTATGTNTPEPSNTPTATATLVPTAVPTLPTVVAPQCLGLTGMPDVLPADGQDVTLTATLSGEVDFVRLVLQNGAVVENTTVSVINGSAVITFMAMPETHYFVQYSTDNGVTWKPSNCSTVAPTNLGDEEEPVQESVTLFLPMILR